MYYCNNPNALEKAPTPSRCAESGSQVARLAAVTVYRNRPPDPPDPPEPLLADRCKAANRSERRCMPSIARATSSIVPDGARGREGLRPGDMMGLRFGDARQAVGVPPKEANEDGVVDGHCPLCECMAGEKAAWRRCHPLEAHSDIRPVSTTQNDFKKAS